MSSLPVFCMCFSHLFPHYLLSHITSLPFLPPPPPQEKRAAFPRFFFIGDEDLLEILGQSTNPQVIQAHLKKLFAGINRVEFSEGNSSITAMKSQEEELVPLSNPITVTTNVEVWLANLTSEMRHTLHSMLVAALATAQGKDRSIDPTKFPSQV